MHENLLFYVSKVSHFGVGCPGLLSCMSFALTVKIIQERGHVAIQSLFANLCCINPFVEKLLVQYVFIFNFINVVWFSHCTVFYILIILYYAGKPFAQCFKSATFYDRLPRASLLYEFCINCEDHTGERSCSNTILICQPMLH